jgi:hypothetical protein
MAEVNFQGQTVLSVWPFSEAKAITLQVSTLKGKDDGTWGPFAKLFRVTRYVDTVQRSEATHCQSQTLGGVDKKIVVY